MHGTRRDRPRGPELGRPLRRGERRAQRLVLGRRAAHDRAEVADEVRVVEVAEVEREPRPVAALAGGELLGGLLEAVAAQDPLRSDADVAAEQALERTR